jgi:hypothetical protein
VHNLAKTGKVNIQIIKTTPSGEVELKWEVLIERALHRAQTPLGESLEIYID